MQAFYGAQPAAIYTGGGSVLGASLLRLIQVASQREIYAQPVRKAEQLDVLEMREEEEEEVCFLVRFSVPKDLRFISGSASGLVSIAVGWLFRKARSLISLLEKVLVTEPPKPLRRPASLPK
jgi:hypothetical protein